jgi:hypothetical protein
MYMGTSNSYATGITNQVIIDYAGNLTVSAAADYPEIRVARGSGKSISMMAGTTYAYLNFDTPLLFQSVSGAQNAGAVERMRVLDSSGNILMISCTPTGGGESHIYLKDAASSNILHIATASTDSSWNALSKAGGGRIIYRAAAVDTGDFMIGPHTAATNGRGMRFDSTGNVGFGQTAASSLGAIVNIGVTLNDGVNYGKALQITTADGARQQTAWIRAGNNVVSCGYEGSTAVWGFGTGNGTDASFTPSYMKFDLTTSAALFGTGIRLPSSGGTPATLNHYEEYSATMTFTGIWAADRSVTITVTRNGNVVTLKIPGTSATTSSSSSINCTAGTVLPTRFRPAGTVYAPCFVVSSSVVANGQCSVANTGTVYFFIAPQAVFPNGVSCGPIDTTYVTWTLS